MEERDTRKEVEMNLPPLPPVLCHAGDADCYTAEQMQEYGQICYEKALLDAMNATLPFGKTGAVIAAAIRSLK